MEKLELSLKSKYKMLLFVGWLVVAGFGRDRVELKIAEIHRPNGFLLIPLGRSRP